MLAAAVFIATGCSTSHTASTDVINARLSLDEYAAIRTLPHYADAEFWVGDNPPAYGSAILTVREMAGDAGDVRFVLAGRSDPGVSLFADLRLSEDATRNLQGRAVTQTDEQPGSIVRVSAPGGTHYFELLEYTITADENGLFTVTGAVENTESGSVETLRVRGRLVGACERVLESGIVQRVLSGERCSELTGWL